MSGKKKMKEFLKNKKVIAIIAIILIVIAIIAIAKKKNSSVTILTFNPKETVDMYQVFEVEDIANSEVELIQTSDTEVATKYRVGENTYLVNANVEFNEREGKVIYLRDGYNDANIYQTTYRIDKNSNVTELINKRMQTFIEACTSYMGAGFDEDSYTETIYGTGSTEEEMPLEEIIYSENRLYNRRYTISDEIEMPEELSEYEDDAELYDTLKKDLSNEREFDINFYMSGDYLVCEFVKIL
jgi:hypothetical protein